MGDLNFGDLEPGDLADLEAGDFEGAAREMALAQAEEAARQAADAPGGAAVPSYEPPLSYGAGSQWQRGGASAGAGAAAAAGLSAGELGMSEEVFGALSADDITRLAALRREQEALRWQYEEVEAALRALEEEGGAAADAAEGGSAGGGGAAGEGGAAAAGPA